MNGIKYYALDENEEVPYEFVVIKNVNGEPEFCASFVNTNSLSYGNGVLLKFHQRNDELRAENAKLRELVRDMLETLYWGDYYLKQTGRTFQPSRYETRMRELGVEVDA